ncbi:hypothetical protein Clacol_007198 [Clathrus columnatus]|uniref:Uncharacterized protein n=1 Tax=Clathrus columnatus TaxID=1419009 RepID=A0AAV5AKH2_9AGAM|nr:hypothetical protein Clacol_007198 [Clathrus columnatus]
MSQQGYYTSSKDRSSTSSNLGAKAPETKSFKLISQTTTQMTEDYHQFEISSKPWIKLSKHLRLKGTHGILRHLHLKTRESSINLPPLTGQTDPAYHNMVAQVQAAERGKEVYLSHRYAVMRSGLSIAVH